MKYITLFFILTVTLFSQTIVVNEQSVYDDFSIEYYLDNSSRMSIEDVSKKDFNQTSANSFAFGYIKSTAWIKFSVDNKSDKENFVLSINESFYEVADLYHYKDGWQKTSNSLFTSVKNRPVQEYQLSFPIEVKQGEKKTYYLKLKAKFAYFGNLVLYEEPFFYQNNFVEIGDLYIFIFGIIVVVIFFNIFLYSATKERVYLYYIAYSFFNIVYLLNISGLLAYADLQSYVYKTHSSTGFLMGFLVLFSLEYFNTKEQYPKVDKVFKLLAGIFFFCGVMLFFSYQPWNQILSQLISVICILLIILSSVVYLKGKTRTKYYTLAMTTYLFFGLIYVLMLNNVFEYNFITRYGVVLASAFEVVVFSLLLATRYNDMKVQVQDHLEKEVSLRTKSLEKANKELTSLADEREVLLKEIHHRVKNNFHMIIGLLTIKNHKSEDRCDSEETINRISLMSEIHEFLYNSKNIEHIDTILYINELTKKLSLILNKLKFNIDIDTFNIDFDTALALGTTINELVTNSSKHNKDEEVVVNISLKKEDTNKIVLKIEDNGKGFEYDQVRKGLGIKLVEQFCKKLHNSSFSFKQENGNRFMLSFETTQVPKSTLDHND